MKKNKIIGLIILLINLLWTFIPLRFLYLYHFSSLLFLIMYPNWILITNLIIGVIGILIGILLLTRKMSIKSAMMIEFPILIVGLLLFLY